MKCSYWLLALSSLSIARTISSFAAISQSSASRFRFSTSFVQNPTASHVRLRLSPEETEDPPAYNTEASAAPTKLPIKCPNCDMCDGSGRIEGGIGVFLEWWPIKAYRPCPNFIERGGFYQRCGQGLDEIAFGRDSTFDIDSKN